jgi:hypothetical protein
MAITNVGKNRVYASIKDLPENQKIVDGDRIIIDTEEGTCLVDYSNLKIGNVLTLTSVLVYIVYVSETVSTACL